jgi:hypothetical protein
VDLAMARLTEGETQAFIAAGVLTEQSPETAPKRLAAVVHHVAGWLTGPLFVTLLCLVGALRGGGVVSCLLTGEIMLVLMVGFFALVVLPRSRGLPRQRFSTIRRAWAVEAAVYLLVLAPLVGAAAIVL